MTHDELLAIVNKYRDDVMSGQIWTTEIFIKALSAVVELHQQLDDNSCRHCVTWYPCSTIQAIEEQLHGNV